MRAVRWSVVAGRLLDVLLFPAAGVVMVMSTARYLAEGVTQPPVTLLAVPLLVVMGRFPLVLSNRAGDAVIGFEASVLVFLLCTTSPAEALTVWSVGMVLEHGFERRPRRVRAFNVSLTVTAGALLVLVASLVAHEESSPAELGVVIAACAVFFGYDVLLTATVLSLATGERLATSLQWRAMPLGLVCFVAVDTLGYLAVVLVRAAPDWTLVLLLVPIVAILLAVHAFSRAQLSERRLAALVDAAGEASAWGDQTRLEPGLVEQAEAVFRYTTAALQVEPAGPGELGCAIETAAGTRFVVVRRAFHARPFDTADRTALEVLTGLATASVERHRLHEQLTHLAGHDPLTGLANRRVFGDALDHALARAEPRRLAVLFCDLDGFKGVNDRYGHHAGNQLLVQAAARLRTCLRPGDLLARLGGDEFALLLPDLEHPAQAIQVAATIHDALAPRFVLAEGEAQVTVSVGVAQAVSGDAGTEVLRNADTAMYRAKTSGKGRTELFEPLMRTDLLNRLDLDEQLRTAIENRALTVVYQPIIDLHTGAIDGFEALSRWRHPRLGVIGPETFVPAAERLGLIAELDDQVLVTAHAQVRELIRRTGARLTLSVNIAPSQVGDPALLQRVGALMNDEPRLPLILELTEQSRLADDPATVQALRQLTETGARLAVDDFGVGYSSIGYLHRLPVDRVKIDKSLVQDLAVRRSYLLVQGVVAMARAMDLQVVVEGIEDAGTAVLLRDLGCDRAQGFFFGHPMSIVAAERLVRLGVAPSWSRSAELTTQPALREKAQR